MSKIFTSRGIAALTQSLTTKSFTAHEIVNTLQKKFEQNLISEPLSSAEFIVAHACGEKTYHRVDPDRSLSPEAMKGIRHMQERRLRSEPIQYIVGDWDFMHLTLLMRPPVFIPRPETEELVNLILSKPGAESSRKFVEVGCGSGAISLSLLTLLPQCKAIALDRNLAACQLTEENARLIGVTDRIEILNHQLQSGGVLPTCTPVDFIVSNPPYIPSDEMEFLDPDIKHHEDLLALEGGPDGLDVIRVILNKSREFLKPGGFIWLEVDSSHAELLKIIVEKERSLDLEFIKSYNDFRNL
ncbi:hypothetical protein CAPTEDRAFT_125507 [Capitella teleta]|uniref:peptide chain release factor N(5)-glutamine methyltransferase n=1 Tax=Capitella teleta TaxID=283909 RepID=R7TIN5_CAPTE|nr:hypothetical protein CAPTEDRAFT_125507 [Capitella teleta]|eukprot:ELT91401.1 hypothetical protein CAPTEDRAFT_125507 [Capitella teleta]